MTKHNDLVDRLTRLNGIKGGKGVQAAIAKKLVVTKATVSGWFSGAREPSSENYFKMAMNACEATDKIWFLRKAGLTSGHMRDVLELLASEEAPAVLIAPLQDTESIKIPISRAFVPRPEASAYLTFSEPYPSEFPGRNDTIIVDYSEREGRSLRPYWDQIVLAHFSPSEFEPSERIVGIEVEGYRVGVLRFQPPRYREVAGKHFLECGAELVDINGRSPGLPVAHKWARAYDKRPPTYEFEPAARAAQKEMKAHASVTICGRVIAWFGYSFRPSDLR